MERSGGFRSGTSGHGSEAIFDGTGGARGDVGSRDVASFRGRRFARKNALQARRKTMCDKPSPVRGVMLHLRARYVSKAAILTIPARQVPVENRSPA
jgi:hypothetical protein